MTKIKSLWYTFSRYEYVGILLLILIILALHFATILQPSQPVFDEQYYVPAARTILQGQGTDRIEHPPLGQLFIASGIRVFGDNPFGWRIFPVLFGAAGILFLYLICRRLNLHPKYAFLAAFLLTFENLGFIQSSVAMLDVFSLTLMLAAFWLYLKGRYTATGIMIGLAALTKLTGILALPVVLVYWLLTSRRNLKGMAYLLIAGPATFLALMTLFDFIIWHKWLNPLSQLSFMLKANALATFASSPSGMLSRPWDWLIRPEILTYWIDPHYIAMISPTLWVLIIPAMAFAIYKAVRGHQAALFAVVWFAVTCLVWIPASLITDRMSYIYYFYPAVGSVCLALSLAASTLINPSTSPDSSSSLTGKEGEDFFRMTGQDARVKKSPLQLPGKNINNLSRRVLGLVVPFYLLLYLGAFVILSPISYWWKLPLCVMAYLVARYYLWERKISEIEGNESGARVRE